jgi:CheY-like chemotaxis protein
MTTILMIGYQTTFFCDLVEILECIGFKTLMANHDYEGLQLANQYHPSVIVYDTAMPTMNGKAVSLALKLSEPTARIPLLFLTAFDPRELPDVPYLLKPFTVDEFLSKLRQLLVQVSEPALYQPA